MSSASNVQAMWQYRAGSYSTHGSRRGVNLLEWGEREELTLEQERDVLIKRNAFLLSAKSALPQNSPAAKELGNEMLKNNVRLGEINKTLGRMRSRDVGHFIIQEFRRRTTKTEWRLIVAEAHRLHEHHLQKIKHELETAKDAQ